MARPSHPAAPPGDDVPSIVARVEAVPDRDERRRARLHLREDALLYRLRAKRLRRDERVADGIAKFVGGSLLTSSAALLLNGHIESWTIGVAMAALFLFLIGFIWAARAEYSAAAWDGEADRIEAALEEMGKDAADG